MNKRRYPVCTKKPGPIRRTGPGKSRAGLFDQAELADDGKLLGPTVGSVYNADDEEDEADDAADGAERPPDLSQDHDDDAPNEEEQALIGVEAGELIILSEEDERKEDWSVCRPVALH